MVDTIRKGEIIPLTFDIMFTEIFNNEENICVLEEFISGYFNYSLDDVRGNLEILSRRLPREEGHAEGHAEGLAEGLIKGIDEGTKNVALNMLREEISLSVISKCTGLSEEELKKIK